MYTVKQLADLAGVSIRTLHYYDQIDLLRPEEYGENGYRYYGEKDLLKLQQILFFRELDFPLSEIKAILHQPGFDQVTALQAHRKTLRERITRLEQLIHTIDRTVGHLQKGTAMSKKDYYKGFNEARQKEHEQYIRETYGDSDQLKNSIKQWANLTPEEKNDFLAHWDNLHHQIAENMDKGAEHPDVQALMQQYREKLNFFYEVSLAHFENLGHMYNSHPEFQANFEAVRPGLAAFMEQAIEHYVLHNDQ